MTVMPGSLSSGGNIQYTPQIIASQMINNILTDESQQSTLEEQISTGNMVNMPSDNPTAAAQILNLQNASNRSTQYSANAQDGLGWLQAGNATLNSVLNTLQTVQQNVLSISSASIAGSSSALQSIASSIQGSLSTLNNLANTQYNGQAIFAGTGNVNEAYDANGNYVGGGSAPSRTVAPGTQVSIGITGPAIFGSGSTGLLGNTAGNMGVLAQIVSDLQTGTTASINAAATTGLAALQSAISQVQNQSAVMGSNYQQMETFSNQATDTQTALQTQVSSLQNTDMPQAISELDQVQQSYQAALWSVSQINQDTLAQYIS